MRMTLIQCKALAWVATCTMKGVIASKHFKDSNLGRVEEKAKDVTKKGKSSSGATAVVAVQRFHVCSNQHTGNGHCYLHKAMNRVAFAYCSCSRIGGFV